MRFSHWFTYRRWPGARRLPRSGGSRARQWATRPLLVECLESRALLSFLPAVNYATGMFPWSVAVRDFNGDGNPDLTVANLGSGEVSILLNDGNWPPGPGGAPGPGAGQGLPKQSLTAVALLASARIVSAAWEPNMIAPNNVARPEPLASPRLVDSIFAAATREEPARAVTEVPPVRHAASSDGRWQPLLNDPDPLEQAIATFAWEET